MNQRRRAFCEEYLQCGNAAEAARRAGYSEKAAKSIGQRLLTFADVQTYLDERNAELKAQNTASIDEVREFWTATMRSDSEATRDKLKASELLAKTYGAFIDRVEATEEISVPRPLVNLSDEELRSLARLADSD